MRLAINGRFLTQSITGVQRYAREFVLALERMLSDGTLDPARYDITLLSPRQGLLDVPVLRHIRHRPVGRFTGHKWEQFELPFHVGRAILFCPGNTAPLAALVGGTPTITVVHSLSYRYFPDAYSRAFRAFYAVLMPVVLRRSAAVITVSEAERAEILKPFPWAARGLDVVPLGGLPSSAALDGPSARKARPYFLYVGALSRTKNFHGVVEAACQVMPERDVGLVVVGATAASFKAIDIQLPDGLADRIEFTGQIDGVSELVGLYKGAIALVFPSRYESSGLPPIEAMACGCPVIASEIPALRERCGDAALFCDPDSVESIAEAMRRLADDPALRERLRDAGLKRAALFDWTACAKRTMQIVEKVAERVSGRGS